MRHLQSVFPWVVLTLLVLLFGCAATEKTPAAAPAAKRAGFLSNYEKLQSTGGDDAAMSWILPGVKWQQYEAVFIERIQVYPKEDDKEQGIDPTDLKMLVDHFYESLVKEIQPVVRIVDTIGPNVLVVRIAIVDLVPTKYGLSIAGTLTPYAFIAEASSGPASGRPAGSTPYLGETSIEVQFLDGQSRQILGEFTDTKIGKKYDVDTSQGGVDAAKTWVNSYMDSFTAWNYAKQAFEEWAAFFRKRFDELRRANPAK